MTPEAQRIAIAEACGYLNPRQSDSGAFLASYAQNANGTYWGTHGIPDYLNSLDAMHEAEKTILGNQGTWTRYVAELKVQSAKYGMPHFHLSAAQRAEAFLRTLNLWTDES